MSNQSSPENLQHPSPNRAKFVRQLILVSAQVTIAGIFFVYGSSKGSKFNHLEGKESYNSPFSNVIQEQYNYYYKDERDTTKPKQKPAVTIEANNALIVTNGQTGGSNTVYFERIPEPTVKLVDIKDSNVAVTEIAANPPQIKKKIALPSEEYNYASLYKTTFTVDYQCAVNITKIAFLIKRDDVVNYKVTHNGVSRFAYGKHKTTNQPVYLLQNPETGKYTFTLYTVNKFTTPLQEIEVIK